MDTISRTINPQKGNKENSRPTSGHSKSSTNREVPRTVAVPCAPLQSKSNEKEENFEKVKTEQKDVRAAIAGNSKKRQTLSQVFLTKQAVKQRKLVSVPTKLPASIPPKPVPGTYKGKVVQSKISSFRKPSSLEGGVENKPVTKTSAPKVESYKLGMVRSKSIADLPGRASYKPPPQFHPQRPKSVYDGHPPVSKCPTASCPTGLRSVVAPARTAPGAMAHPGSRKSAMLSKGKDLSQSSKPKMPVATDKKVRKPPSTSTLSQYRFSMETAEERRAKLAEWLASKGKTLKRPTVSAVPPPRAKSVLQPKVPQPDLKGPKPDPAAQPETDQVPEQEAVCPSSPLIINTTLDLLDNSMDLPVDPEVTMRDVVVNLCNALEAMETPSAYVDEPQEMKEELEVKMVGSEPNKETLKEEPEERNESPENALDFNRPEDVEVKSEAGEGTTEQKVKRYYVQVFDNDDEDLMETIPEAERASMVKYSVKTTPYLQSIKRTIEGEACASDSRRKSGIKDLKFLTPVRRSCRIQRKSSRLPGMLTDHDPCVSSLAELVQLDNDANAYIYRRNPALLEDLPDHPRDLERV